MDAPLRGEYKAPGDCSVDGCESIVRTKGLCRFHYQRSWQGTNMEAPKRVTAAPRARMARDAEGRKQCMECEQWLDVSNFRFHPRSGDRLYGRCDECARFERIERLYGLSRLDFEKHFDEQGRRCAICRTTESAGRFWSVDHDHACCPTDKTCGQCFRGILCDPCNNGLGRFRDSPEVIRAAAEYLESRKR